MAEPMNISDQQALYQLQTWLSPSFPVGAYTYSHGLENAFEQGLVGTVDQAVSWIGDIVSRGNGFADAVFLAHAHRAVTENNPNLLSDVAEFAIAFSGTRELRLESEAQGAAFIDVVQKVDPNRGLEMLQDTWTGPFAYSVALGAASGGLAIDHHATCIAYLHGFVANLTSALVRLVPLGQTDGQRIIARLAKPVQIAVERVPTTDLDDLATSTLMVDLTSMHHETQYTRLFRS